MQKGAAQIIARDFARGFFDTIDALLAIGISPRMGEADELTEETLKDLLGRHGVCMRGTIESSGAIAVLMTAQSVLKLTSEVMGTEAPDSETLGEDEKKRVFEVFEPCLGGGCGGLKDTMQRELSLQGVSVEQEDPANAGALLEALGGSLYYAPFTFSAPSGLEGEGAILMASSLGNLLPDDVLADAVAGDVGPDISGDEVNDILSGFDPGAAQGAAGGKPAQNAPENLDMVMDIRLVCTARLGRVEMPIADILDLGPGSIIEVGHLVDEPVELLVNDKLIARGDVVVVDEKFGLRITEIVSPAERIKSLG